MSGSAVVTGGAGFIGSAVAAELDRLGYRVRRVDLRPGPGVTVGDVSRPGDWCGLLDGVDLLVHAAARVGEQGTSEEFRRHNVDTTRAVLDACGAAAVGRVVHISSIVVHGRDFEDGVDEDAPVAPTGNPYTDTKIASEHLALARAARSLPVTVVRPGDVYGPGSPQWTLRPVELMRRRLFRLYDHGRGILSPIYLDDLVRGVVTVGTHPDTVGGIYHLTGGVGVSAAEFFGHYARALGVRPGNLSPRAVPALDAATRIARLAGREPPFSAATLEYVTHPGTYSIERARRVAGWRPMTDLDEGMRRTLAWLRGQGLLGTMPTG